MPIDLPRPIADYFDAYRDADVQALVRCFTEDAVITDERQTHRGHYAVAAWKADVSAKYRYAVEPVALDVTGEHTVVTGRLTGDFPGSPLDLRYRFVLAGERIAALEIAP